MARFEGDGSYQELLVRIYNKNLTGSFKNTEEADHGTKINPFSFNRSGYYLYNTGSVNGIRLYQTLYWTIRQHSLGLSFFTYFHGSVFRFNNADYKGEGMPVRCVAKPSSLLILFVPKGGRWQKMREVGAGITY